MQQHQSFARRNISMPQHPEVLRIYSYPDRRIYVNVKASPGANIVLFEAPKG